MRRIAPALAVVALVATAPGAAADDSCDVSGDITYDEAAVAVVTTVDLAPCRLVGKVGRLSMTVELHRYDYVTRETTVTHGRPVRCAVRARSCTIRLRVPHEPTELARYEATATYEGDGGRHVTAGSLWISTKCYSVAATYASCYVPV